MDDLDRAKAATLGQVLFKTARLFNEQAVAALRAQSGRDVRTAHTLLLPHLDLGGTRLTTLAARVGLTKQAVGQIVDDLVAQGVLERIPDPTDGRAKLVRFTDEGRRSLFVGLAVLGAIRDELATDVGAELLDRLHADLHVVLQALERRASHDAQPEK